MEPLHLVMQPGFCFKEEMELIVYHVDLPNICLFSQNKMSWIN